MVIFVLVFELWLISFVYRLERIIRKNGDRVL